MKNILRLFPVCLLSASILCNAAVQPVKALAANQANDNQVTKQILPASKALKEDLDKLISQNIFTSEQAELILHQLTSGKPPTEAAELKDCLNNLVHPGITTPAQAVLLLQTIYKYMPEGLPEMPEVNAVYSQSGKAATKTKQAYIGSRQNESGIIVAKNGQLTITDSAVKTSGSSSFESASDLIGLNAGILARSGGAIYLSESSVTTTGDGATAIFATDADSSINLANVKIDTSGNDSCGLAATAKGSIQAENMDILTIGDQSPAIAAGRVNGVVTLHKAVVKTTGKDSPAVYSIGNIKISDTSATVSDSEAAIIEGRSSLTLDNTKFSGAKLRGILLFQEYTGRLETGLSSFTMNGGCLPVQSGPAFTVANIEGIIALTDAKVSSSANKLLEVAASKWGTKGLNGGKLTFNATRENLSGSIFCDNISTLAINLKDHTILAGTINEVRTSGSVNLALDNTSIWDVTGDSYLSSLTDADITLANIQDNGFTVYYDASLPANQWLGGKTCLLKNGGKLTPSAKL